MKKVVRHHNAHAEQCSPAQKHTRDNVWCDKFGYFIDLDACQARSYQKSVCRRCYASLLQTSLPFD
jgi:hypothetical protein